jgi:uncharacterized protein
LRWSAKVLLENPIAMPAAKPPRPSAKPPSRPSPDLRSKPRPVAPQPSSPPETVDPIWLAQALALSLAAALVCAWLTVCLLFFQGAWQLVLRPTRSIDQTPASAGLDFEQVRFDAAESGQPRLTAWWIPAQGSAQPGSQLALQPVPRYAFTILYLHDGWGSLSATVPALARLHRAGLDVFAVDYRGFGLSEASFHPSEARMAQDTVAALDYLVSTRHIPARSIVPYGEGLGASLAANLALHHPELPAVILANPDPDPTATAVAAHPSRVVPVRLLFRERFATAAPLAALATPKLLIAGGPDSSNEANRIRALGVLFHQAASPSFTVTLPPIDYEADYQSALTRFLDQYSTPAPRTPVR